MFEKENEFMTIAIELSLSGMRTNKGGPFGAIVVKGNQVIGRGCNNVLSSCDPTAHAEVVAIREACKYLNDFQLTGCEIYTSCEPCPMCLGALYWSRIDKIYYANSRDDAKQIGFDDSMIYEEMNIHLNSRKIPMIQVTHTNALKAFQEWKSKIDKNLY